MKVNEAFLSNFNDAQITDFYVDEMGRETMGEMNRFDILVRYGRLLVQQGKSQRLLDNT